MPTWQQKLKQEFDNDPIKVVAVGALALTAVAKVIDSWGARTSRRAYAAQVYRPRG